MAGTKQTTRTFDLNSGAKIPAVGLGTWQSKPEEVTDAVKVALQTGYVHVDTAAAYGNEKDVGEGIKASGVPREKIWLTTKLNNPDHRDVPGSIKKSLENLGTDYVDLYLMHWPASVDVNDSKKVYDDWSFTDTWREMQKLLETGQAKNIGVSNFSQTNLEKLLSHPDTKVVPAVNQIELHPCNPSPKLVEFCKSKGIHCTAYSCLGSTDSPLYKNKDLLALAEAKGKTPQQVLLLWNLQLGRSVIPKSVTGSRIKANFELDDASLTDEELGKVSAIKDRFKVCTGDFLPVPIWDGKDE